jgi:HlyD family secretion protein
MTIDTTRQGADRLAGVRVASAAADGAADRMPGADAAATPAPAANAGTGGRRAGRLTRKRLAWGAAGAALLAMVALSMRPTPVEVQTGVASVGPLETTVNAEGVTRVRDRFAVGAPVSGRLERIALREGDAVAAGAVIARITPLPLDPQAATQARARLAAAAAGTQEAAARLEQAREARDQAERTAARVREVAGAGGMSTDALERAELQSATAAREFQAAQARVRAADAELAVARAALLAAEPVGGAGVAGSAAAEVRAPAAGRILRLHGSSERIVSAGTPLVEVGDAAGLEVVVDVLSTDAVRIAPGAAMRLVEWGGEGALDARVRLVEPSGFTKVSTLGVEEQRVNVIGDLASPPPSLGDGYRVEARIVTWEAPAVLRVPNSALFRTGSEWSVFVEEDGRARLRPVQVGHRGAAEAEITAGLAEGERVILFPSDRIRDGVRVTEAR